MSFQLDSYATSKFCVCCLAGLSAQRMDPGNLVKVGDVSDQRL